IGEYERQTSSAKDVLNNDYKNEQYELVYDPDQMKGSGNAQVEVWDFDSITGNDLIGVATVDVFPSLNNNQDIELYLQPKKDKDAQQYSNADQGIGKVRFKMIYQPGDVWIKNFEEQQQRLKKEAEELKRIHDEEVLRLQEEERKKFEEERRKQAELDAKYVKGTIKISKIQVQSLKAMDFNGKSDPYVIFRVDKQEKKTTVAKKTLNYDYKNETYEIAYDPLVQKGKKEVEVEVWDYDSITGDDLIGIATVDV
ncbi:MAG: hypothetical protein EZS28_051880, partial [Streblomastix strix]